MKFLRVLSFALCFTMILAMAGCETKAADIGTLVQPGVVAQTKVLLNDDAAIIETAEPESTEEPASEESVQTEASAASDAPRETSVPENTELPSGTDEPVVTEEPSVSTETPIAAVDSEPSATVEPDNTSVEEQLATEEPVQVVPETVSSIAPEDIPDQPSIVAPEVEAISSEPIEELDPMTQDRYRFQNFVLNRAGTGNAVISGEALLMSVDMWSEMLTGQTKSIYDAYVGRDYLNFDGTENLTILRRIWADDSLVAAASDIEDLFYPITMSDASATTEKNNWVAEQTNDYISYTPSTYTDSTVMDMMSVIALKDTWNTGLKPYDNGTRIFYNADGTETKTVMFRDEGLTYWDLGNAKAYCMYLTNKSYAMFILPNRGVDMTEVDVSGLMTGQISSTSAHVRFYMPEFSVESAYQLTPSNLGLPVGSTDVSVVSGVPTGFEPVFSQLSKLSVSRAGIGDVSADGIGSLPSVDYSDGKAVVDIICDHPFMYYVGDSENADVAFFGVFNQLTPEAAVTLDQIPQN